MSFENWGPHSYCLLLRASGGRGRQGPFFLPHPRLPSKPRRPGTLSLSEGTSGPPKCWCSVSKLRPQFLGSPLEEPNLTFPINLPRTPGATRHLGAIPGS